MFSAVLAFLVGIVLAFSVPGQQILETVYTVRDERAGSVFRIKFRSSEEPAVHKLITTARPEIQAAGLPEGREPYRILRIRQNRRLGPRIGAFLKGAGAVWLLYFFVQILIRDYIIGAYRRDLGRIKKRRKKGPGSSRKRT